MKTFYANAIEGIVLCGADDLPQGGNWIVSDDPQNVVAWLHDATESTEYFKVSNNVLLEVASVFGINN